MPAKAPVKKLDEIIRGCQSGRRSDQQLLYEQFADKMYAVCLRYTRDRSEAEDVLHEGFIKAFSGIGGFSWKGAFEGWLRKVMVNAALERYRKQHWLYPVEEVPEREDDHWEGTDMEVRTADLMKMIQELPPRYRMAFNLVAIEGYGHKEAAGLLGISEGTSKSNLARARVILQKKVRQRYGEPGVKEKNNEQRG